MKIIDNRKNYFIISGIFILLGFAFMAFNAATGKGAFNYDVEFSGGTSFQIDIKQAFQNDDIAAIVTEVTGQTSPQIQQVGGTNEVMIKIRSIDQPTRAKLIDTIAEKYALDKDQDFTYQDVSPTVSSEMQQTAILAVLVACAAMLVYISIRFKDVRMGGSAILALLHDSCCMLTLYAVLRIPLNYSFIAAILTILGYSINATIVIFDRIRENRGIMRKSSLKEMIDSSISQTLRRSVYTSLTTLLAILCLYIFGVSSIKDFTLPIIGGLIFGTYSSVFLAGSIWYMMAEGFKRQGKQA